MANLNEVYKCEVCGNIIEVLHGGKGTLVCCGKPMVLQQENTVEASYEKHIPVVAQTADGYKVTVGSAVHPMEEKHYIEWIELVTADGRVLRQDLKPGQLPEAAFCVNAAGAGARAYCNLHGHWKSN